MKLTPIRKSGAFARVELIVVLVAIIIFSVLAIIEEERGTRAESYEVSCINNLKQISFAYRVWAEDHNEHYPASVSVTHGGWNEVLSNVDLGSLCWTNYAIMANELGWSNNYWPVDFPKGLVCPSDDRKPARNFSNFVSNINLSYFVAVSAEERYPQSLLCGDRNLGEGTKPDRDYGFSPESGKGNDVTIQTNSKTGPVCWSREMHSLNTNGGGNILLADGSVEQCNSARFRQKFQPGFEPTTNWPTRHAPSSPSIRVLFP
jgi:prepilin-type processing-associated H-X9-DG protein